MYSRSYFQGDADISVPENYDGTAFFSEAIQTEAKAPRIEPIKSDLKFSPKDEKTSCECDEVCARDEHYEGRKKDDGDCRTDLKGLFGSALSGTRLASFLPKDFGFEEILIIGLALFLLFSPERDIECALLLLGLVFIR